MFGRNSSGRFLRGQALKTLKIVIKEKTLLLVPMFSKKENLANRMTKFNAAVSMTTT